MGISGRQRIDECGYAIKPNVAPQQPPEPEPIKTAEEVEESLARQVNRYEVLKMIVTAPGDRTTSQNNSAATLEIIAAGFLNRFVQTAHEFEGSKHVCHEKRG